MAYRKTDAVLAEIEGRKTKIVQAAITIISSKGAAALTSDKVASKAKLSVGLIYKHFPDMDELRAHVFAQFLARDLDVLQSQPLVEGLRAWTKLLSANAHLAGALANDFGYRDGIKRELAKQLRAAGHDYPTTLAAALCGAIIEASRSLTAPNGAQLSTILLRAIGLPSKVRA